MRVRIEGLSVSRGLKVELERFYNESNMIRDRYFRCLHSTVHRCKEKMDQTFPQYLPTVNSTKILSSEYFLREHQLSRTLPELVVTHLIFLTVLPTFESRLWPSSPPFRLIGLPYVRLFSHSHFWSHNYFWVRYTHCNRFRSMLVAFVIRVT